MAHETTPPKINMQQWNAHTLAHTYTVLSLSLPLPTAHTINGQSELSNVASAFQKRGYQIHKTFVKHFASVASSGGRRGGGCYTF